MYFFGVKFTAMGVTILYIAVNFEQLHEYWATLCKLFLDMLHTCIISSWFALRFTGRKFNANRTHCINLKQVILENVYQSRIPESAKFANRMNGKVHE